MDTKNYTSIKIPKEVAVQIDSIIEGSGLIYRSRSDFIFCAIREYIFMLQREKKTC